MITGFYLPAVTGETLQTIQTCSVFVLAGIFGVVALMMFLTLMALLYRAAMGSQQERAVAAFESGSTVYWQRWSCEQTAMLPHETSKSTPDAGPCLVVPSRIIWVPWSRSRKSCSFNPQELWIMNGGAPKLPALAVELQRITGLLSLMKEEEKPKSRAFRVTAGDDVQVEGAWSLRLEGVGGWPIHHEQRGRGSTWKLRYVSAAPGTS